MLSKWEDDLVSPSRSITPTTKREWLLRKAALEDGCDISVGGTAWVPEDIYDQILKAQPPEESRAK